MYYVPPGPTLHSLFKASRALSKHAVGVMIKRQFCMREEDIAVWEADKSGIAPLRAPGWEGVDPEKRLWHIVHRDLQTHQSGSAVNVMTAKFAEVFARRLGGHCDVRDEWRTLPDLNTFLRKEMLHAAVEALCGSKILEMAPTFVDDLWAYDDAFPIIFRKMPRLFAPRAYAARERLHEHMQNWHLWAAANFQWNSAEALEAEWEPVYGSRLMRARVKMMREAGMSLDGMAALDLGFVRTWVPLSDPVTCAFTYTCRANANAIPAAIWAVFDILRVKGLKSRVLADTDPSFTLGASPLTVDIPRLCALPLLTSIYMEELRQRAAATVTRQVVTDDFVVEGWRFRQGANVVAMPWFGGQDGEFWEGRGGEDVERFWAERFLEYPDDSASGPIWNYKSPGVDHAQENKGRTAEDDKKARVVTAGIQGHYFPYGGGVKICPGRFFAKQEIMAAVAVLLRIGEVELVDGEAAEGIKGDMRRFPLGTLPMDGKVPFRIRRRGM